MLERSNPDEHLSPPQMLSNYEDWLTSTDAFTNHFSFLKYFFKFSFLHSLHFPHLSSLLFSYQILFLLSFQPYFPFPPHLSSLYHPSSSPFLFFSSLPLSRSLLCSYHLSSRFIISPLIVSLIISPHLSYFSSSLLSRSDRRSFVLSELRPVQVRVQAV